MSKKPIVKQSKLIIIGVDPGVKGGAAFIAGDTIQTLSFIDKTDAEMYRLFSTAIHKAVKGCRVVVFLEEITPNLFGCSKSSVAKLYGSFTSLKMLFIAMDYIYRVELVQPKVWQKTIGLSKKKGEAYDKWKKRLRERAQQLFPQHSIWQESNANQVSVCDALLIAEHGRRVINARG